MTRYYRNWIFLIQMTFYITLIIENVIITDSDNHIKVC